MGISVCVMDVGWINRRIVNEAQKEAYRNKDRQLDRPTQTETEAQTWRQIQTMASTNCELTQIQIKVLDSANTNRYSVYFEDVIFTVSGGGRLSASLIGFSKWCHG